MRLPTVAGSPATCGHGATGDPRVTVEGIPISVIGTSTAGAPIIFPSLICSTALKVFYYFFYGTNTLVAKVVVVAFLCGESP